MPIAKKTESMPQGMAENMPSGGRCCSGGKGQGHGCDHFGKKILMTLFGLLLVYLILYVGVAIRSGAKKYNFIGLSDQMERTITVSGFGKVTGKNDLAATTIGYSNVDKEVAKAQTENARVMDKVVAELKKLGVADKDLRSDYSIYPEYNYTQNRGQELVGYRVSNNIAVKIRDLSKISAILSLPGQFGATQVSGLNFTIDDPENLKAQARDKAVADTKAKAQKLASALGARLVEVVAYNEYESGGGEIYPAIRSAVGLGGGVGGPAPESIASGSGDVTMNVNITYKIVTR